MIATGPVGPVARLSVARLPLSLVAGTHSGRNAAYVAASADRGATSGHTLWLTGPLQRALAESALRTASAAAVERLELDGLPGGCPCCAQGAALGAGLGRLLRQRVRAGATIESLVIQLEPDGDPATLADRLREPPCDRLAAITAIVAVLSADELGRLAASGPGSGGRGGQSLRCVGAAEWVVVAPPATADAAASVAPSVASSPRAPVGAAPSPGAGSLSTVLGPDWSGTLHRLDQDGVEAGIIVPPGWAGFAHDPFGGSSGPWQVIGRWPAVQRFDRTAVADWLARLECEPAIAGVAFIGRTERQWLGWRPGQTELPVTWRADSRLAIRIRPSISLSIGQAVAAGGDGLEGSGGRQGAIVSIVAAAPLLASGEA